MLKYGSHATSGTDGGRSAGSACLAEPIRGATASMIAHTATDASRLCHIIVFIIGYSCNQCHSDRTCRRTATKFRALTQCVTLGRRCNKDPAIGIAQCSIGYYLRLVTTMTLKLPETLHRGVEEEARRQGVSKSALVRECVEAMLRRKRRRKPPTCLDLVADLVGSQAGPRDASVNRRYLEQAIIADHGRGRTNSR